MGNRLPLRSVPVEPIEIYQLPFKEVNPLTPPKVSPIEKELVIQGIYRAINAWMYSNGDESHQPIRSLWG
jgi:hypothetical protein